MENKYHEMTYDRYYDLMWLNKGELTQEEIDGGWHWCSSWDDLLVGPGMDNALVCRCNLSKIEEWKASPSADLLREVLKHIDDDLNNEDQEIPE